MTMPFTIVGTGDSNNINEIEVIVNLDLSKMYNWSTELHVDFNPKKTECIIFSTNQAANKPCIVFLPGCVCLKKI
jgi:hypothetical protein